MTHDEDLLHTLLLSYGIVVWVTQGIMLGQRRAYLGIEVDDIFGATQLWDGKHQAGNSGLTFRLTSYDVNAMLTWLESVRKWQRNAGNLELDLAFNGGGATE